MKLYQYFNPNPKDCRTSFSCNPPPKFNYPCPREVYFFFFAIGLAFLFFASCSTVPDVIVKATVNEAIWESRPFKEVKEKTNELEKKVERQQKAMEKLRRDFHIDDRTDDELDSRQERSITRLNRVLRRLEKAVTIKEKRQTRKLGR